MSKLVVLGSRGALVPFGYSSGLRIMLKLCRVAELSSKCWTWRKHWLHVCTVAPQEAENKWWQVQQSSPCAPLQGATTWRI